MAGNSVSQLQGWLTEAASTGSKHASALISRVRQQAEPLWQKYKPTGPVGWTAAAGLGFLAAALLSLLLVALQGVLTAVAWTIFSWNIVLVVVTTTGLALGGGAALVFAGFASVVGLIVLSGAAALFVSHQVLLRAWDAYTWVVRQLQDSHHPATMRDQRTSTGRDYKDSGERVAGSIFPKLDTSEAAAVAEEPQPATPPPVSTLLAARNAGGSPDVPSTQQQAGSESAGLGSISETEKLEAVLNKPLNHQAPAFVADTALGSKQVAPTPATGSQDMASIAQGAAVPQVETSKGISKGSGAAASGFEGAAVPGQEASMAGVKEAQKQGAGAQAASMGGGKGSETLKATGGSASSPRAVAPVPAAQGVRKVAKGRVSAMSSANTPAAV